jgi:hypothetical protein
VKVIGLAQGHWFKCPKGKWYSTQLITKIWFVWMQLSEKYKEKILCFEKKLIFSRPCYTNFPTKGIPMLFIFVNESYATCMFVY